MSDFWSKRLGAPAVPPTPPVSPSALPPQFRAATPATQAYVAPATQGATEAPRKAASARQHDLCPACGSGNYFSPPGGGRARCFECGYPVEQSTSGVTSTTSQGGAAQPAQQASGYSGGFQPHVIVNK